MDEKERLKKHLEYLCSFDKLTGEPEALLAVNYLIQTLKEDGISCHTEKFDAYLSNPIHSHLVIDGEEIPSRPRSFSESTSKPLHVPVIYDHGTGKRFLWLNRKLSWKLSPESWFLDMDMMSVMQNYWNSTVQLAGSRSGPPERRRSTRIRSARYGERRIWILPCSS